MCNYGSKRELQLQPTPLDNRRFFPTECWACIHPDQSFWAIPLWRFPKQAYMGYLQIIHFYMVFFHETSHPAIKGSPYDELETAKRLSLKLLPRTFRVSWSTVERFLLRSVQLHDGNVLKRCPRWFQNMCWACILMELVHVAICLKRVHLLRTNP